MSTRPVARAAAGMGAAAAVSRAFGALRVLVVAAVLGTTYLGNAFQGANQFSTVLFELLAAGALSAVLVPSFVALLDRGADTDAEALAGGVLGVALAALAVVVAVGMLAAPLLADLLTSGVDDPAVAAEQAALTTTLLRWFLPQLLLYALGAVATAVLHARRRFAVPALAPIGNTVVMVACLLAFRAVAGADPGLTLTRPEVLLLAAAGTLGVAAFVAVPTVVLARSGFRLRPRWGWPDPGVRRLLALGSWATVQHAAAAVLLGAAIVVGGAVAGGVVAFQVGWFFFLAPYGILGQPVQTTVLPALTNEWERDDRSAFSASLRWAVGATAGLLLPLTAVFVVLAGPLAEVVSFGEARSGDGVSLIAAAIGGLGTGLVAYALYLLLARAWYVLGESRLPALVSLAAAAVGAVVMLAIGRLADDEATRLVVGLGLAHTAAFGLAAVVLAVILAQRTGVHVWSARLLPATAVAAAAGALAWCALQWWDPSGRPANLAAGLVLGALVLAVSLGANRFLGLLGAHPTDRVVSA